MVYLKQTSLFQNQPIIQVVLMGVLMRIDCYHSITKALLIKYYDTFIHIIIFVVLPGLPIVCMFGDKFSLFACDYLVIQHVLSYYQMEYYLDPPCKYLVLKLVNLQ